MANPNNPDKCYFFVPDHLAGFQYAELAKGEVARSDKKEENQLVFLLGGALSVNINEYKNHIVRGREMIFLSKFADCRIKALAPCKLLVLFYTTGAFSCVIGESDRLFRLKENVTYQPGGIPINKPMYTFATQVADYLNAGMSCPHLHEIKQKELFLIFKRFYTDEEKIQLFYHALGRDPSFTEAVLSHYMKVRTAQELASMLGYSSKTFEKLFKQCFGTTPYRWMQQHTASRIKGRLLDPSIPLKRVMDEFGFATSSHFNVYCRRNFGVTPGQVRNSVTD